MAKYKKSKVIEHELVVLTAEGALEWSGRNYYNNRKKRKAHIRALVSDMKSGRFNSGNGQTIVIDEDGVVYDGQHRLEAQAKAGVTLVWLVVTVDDGPAAWRSMDSTARRCVADFLRDKDNASARGSLAAFGYAMEHGTAPLASTIQGKKDSNSSVTNAESLEYEEENVEKLTVAVVRGKKMYDQVRCGGVLPFTAFALLVDYVGEGEYLDEFAEDVASIAPDCKTVVAMQKKIIAAFGKKSKKKPDRKWLIGLLFDAYDHFKLMDDSVELNKQSLKFKRYDKLMQETRGDGNGKA